MPEPPISLIEDLGISEALWDQLPSEEQTRIIQGQARLIAAKDLMGMQMLEDDDRDIRRRTDTAQRTILGQDATSCGDEPIEPNEYDDMRTTVLGDMNVTRNETATQQKNIIADVAKWAVPTLIAGGLGAAAMWYANRPDAPNVSNPNAYEIRALPAIPAE